MSEIIPINLIEKAARISVLAHSGKTRKGDGLPYVIHPFMVALKLAKYSFSETVIAAALTHDVLEETDFPEKELLRKLGGEVLEIVKAVTNDESLSSWVLKKKKYVKAVRNGPEGAKAVAVADKIHNLESLLIAYAERGPEIWKKFNSPKEDKLWFENEVLKMLKEAWQHPLIDEYQYLIEKETSLIEQEKNL